MTTLTQAARQHRPPWIDSPLRKEQRRRVCAESIKRGMAQRYLPRITADDVPGHAGLRGHQDQDGDVLMRGTVDEPGEQQGRQQRRQRQDAAGRDLPRRSVARRNRLRHG
jgi:hypothetical protein